MNWEAIGALGEVFGAVALLFVVIQVRHARAEMTRSIRMERTDTLLRILQDRVGDRPRSELNAKVQQALGGQPTPFQALLMERAGLTSAEANITFTEWMIWWQYYAEKVIRYAGELSSADRFQADNFMRTMFGSTVGRLWFDTSKPTLNPDAVRYVENLLATS